MGTPYLNCSYRLAYECWKRAQKDFVIELIETEINRDLTQRAAQVNAEKNPNVSRDLSEDSAEVGEQPEEQKSAAVSGDFDGENEEFDAPDEDKDMGMSMGM